MDTIFTPKKKYEFNLEACINKIQALCDKTPEIEFLGIASVEEEGLAYHVMNIEDKTIEMRICPLFVLNLTNEEIERWINPN